MARAVLTIALCLSLALPLGAATALAGLGAGAASCCCSGGDQGQGWRAPCCCGEEAPCRLARPQPQRQDMAGPPPHASAPWGWAALETTGAATPLRPAAARPAWAPPRVQFPPGGLPVLFRSLLI